MQVCSYFLAGYCAYGRRCHFAHLQPDGTPLPGEHIEAPRTEEPASQASSGSHAEELGAMSQQPYEYSGHADAAWQDNEAAWGSYPADAHQSYAEQDYSYEGESWEYRPEGDSGHDGPWQDAEEGTGEAAHDHQQEAQQQGAQQPRLPLPADLGDAC